MVHTSSTFHNTIHLLPCLHSPQIKRFHNRSCPLQLRRIVRWGCKLLNNPSPYSRRWLLPSHNRRITKITLNKEYHLLITDQHIIRANCVEPALHGSTHTGFIFIGAHTGGGGWWGNCWDYTVWVGREEMVCKFLELGVGAADVPELSRAEFGEVGLGWKLVVCT